MAVYIIPTGQECGQYVSRSFQSRQPCGVQHLVFLVCGRYFLLHSPLQVLLILLPTGSEEREVLGVGSIPVAILPSCQYMKILHFNCTDMNIVG